MSSPTKMPESADKTRLYRRFEALIEKGEFFQAHETLEPLWHRLKKDNDPLSFTIKGFINAAVSFELYKRGRTSHHKPWQTYLKYSAKIVPRSQEQRVKTFLNSICYNLKNLHQRTVMNIEKIGCGENPDKVKAIIEIPYGSNIKYEVDKESGAVEVDRVMYSAMYYPANYGFVANTLADDGDPADIMIVTEYPLQAGSFIKCRLVGVLVMEDEAGMDEKLLAVPVSKLDPTFDHIQDIEDFPEHTLKKIKNFFETYKMLEPNKWVKVKEYKNKAEATKLLDQAIKNYK